MLDEVVRILFVDDDQLVLNALRRTLRSSPWEVHLCVDSTDALRMVRDERIDVVVTDQAMPQLSGVELLSLLAVDHDQVVRVMMTGHGDHDLAMRAINEGNVFRFVDKPWNDAALNTILTDAATLALRRRQEDQERRAMLTGRVSVRVRRDEAQSLFDSDTPRALEK